MSLNHENTDAPEKEMSLVEHIGELRYRITRAGIGIIVGMCFCWVYNTVRWDEPERTRVVRQRGDGWGRSHNRWKPSN